MPAAVAIPAITGAIGVGTSLFGASKQSKAAKQAAEIQSQAAQAAGQKVEGAVRDANPQIVNNAANASDMALRAGGQAVDAGNAAAANVNTAVTGANALLNPYAQAGSAANDVLSRGLADGGQFNKTPTMADIQIDPSFAWMKQQEELAMGHSAAARGGAISGAALKDLTNYEYGANSQEYAKAFARFAQNRQSNFDFANTVAGRGQQAAGTQGSNLMSGAATAGGFTTDAAKVNLGANEFAGSQTYDAAKTTAANTIHGADQAADYLTQGANAQAAGKIGSANAWSSGLGGVANAAGNAGAMYLTATGQGGYANLFKNPAAAARPAMGPPQVTPTTTGWINPKYGNS